ncbi:hypothetical protein DBR40_10345 [Pedobacter sp. KBW01]|nr:hypothetical protein DBR40_10345 [Pedobacter sp. KBW01]
MNIAYFLFGFFIVISFAKKINDIIRDIKKNNTGKLKADAFFLGLMILATIIVFFALSNLNHST